MPSGVRESDSAIIKRSLTNLDTKVSAQNEEISALKGQISELTLLIKSWMEGSKCDKCALPHENDSAGFVSANEMEIAVQSLRRKETKRKQNDDKKNESIPNTIQPKPSNGTSTPKKRRRNKPTTGKNAPVPAPEPASVPARAASTPASHNEDKNEWTSVTTRKQRQNQQWRNKQVVRCSGASSDILAAADSTRYLHVWGAHPDTTESNVINYLNTKTKSTAYSVVKMIAKRPTNYASFKVGVPGDLYEECTSPQFWPKGFSAERWFFRLERPASRDSKTA